MNLEALNESPRLLLQAELKPVQGTRFQPTGFPDLGAAEYSVTDGRNMRNMLLLESAQSMANRLEAACWDEGQGDLVPALQGLPYVKSTLPDGTVTSSILEAHRLNSPYLCDATGYEVIKDAVGFIKDAPFDRRKLATALLRFDPNSLLHGIFLEKIGGVVRLPRALSAFVEAEDVHVAAAGGVKFDRVQPTSAGTNTKYGSANEGYGNVPYHRDEYTAKRIVAYFNLDLALLRGLGLKDAALRLMTTLALYKIRRFLEAGLRLRTACDLDVVGEVEVQRPDGFALPTTEALEQALPALISECAPLFNDPRVLELTYDKDKKSARTKKD
ncbi:MAG: type I-U CRISPR-associated protein Cas7 [Deltaproteobacteria bacterium]|nr:type I-U CRISPR-associated protein Cas7 [Deltaproteobacteria bacterium]